MNKETYQISGYGDLPKGFALPKAYAQLIDEKAWPDIEPWWWLGKHPDSLSYWVETLRDQFPDRVLVPIAKDGATDDVVCFDGTDHSDDPKILIIHSFCSPGWELRNEFKNFSSWIKIAIEESYQWYKERWETLSKDEQDSVALEYKKNKEVYLL